MSEIPGFDATVNSPYPPAAQEGGPLSSLLPETAELQAIAARQWATEHVARQLVHETITVLQDGVYGRPRVNAQAFNGKRAPEDLHTVFYGLLQADERVSCFDLDKATYYEITADPQSPERMALNYLKALAPQVVELLYQKNGPTTLKWPAFYQIVAERGVHLDSNERLLNAFKLFVRLDPRVKQERTSQGKPVVKLTAPDMD